MRRGHDLLARRAALVGVHQLLHLRLRGPTLAVRRCGGFVRRCSARWRAGSRGGQAPRARCATYTAELALSQPQVAMRLARAGPVAQAGGGGGRCVKRGPGRLGVQRWALCAACAAAIFSWRAAGLLRSSCISGLSAIACCSIGFPFRVSARFSMSIPPPGWPKAVRSAKGSGGVRLSWQRLRSLASASKRQGAPIGTKGSH